MFSTPAALLAITADDRGNGKASPSSPHNDGHRYAAGLVPPAGVEGPGIVRDNVALCKTAPSIALSVNLVDITADLSPDVLIVGWPGGGVSGVLGSVVASRRALQVLPPPAQALESPVSSEVFRSRA